MSWIKRNLFFFIGSIVAVLLMGLAGFYLYTKWQLDNEVREKLNQDYATLKSLNQENPHPGSGPVNNIETAKKQQKEVRDLTEKVRKHFDRIPGIPDSGTNVTSQEYKAALDRTIALLQKEATNASVILPPDYAFSFTAQRPRVTFAGGSLYPLSVQLGEVHAISTILFQAKINYLDNIRRERVSTDDSGGPQTEYLLKKSTTNDLAILAPYELTFRCFSSELGAALSGFASSPYGLLVNSVNVEVAPAVAAAEQPISPIPTMVAPPTVVQPGYPRMPGMGRGEGGESAAFMQRYGLGGGAPGGVPGRGGGIPGGIPLRPLGPGGAATPYPAYPTPTAPPGTTPGVAATTGKGGLPSVLDERLLKVTLNVDVIKLLPSK